MKIEKIEWKNISGYGEKLQTIEYDSNGKLVLVSGKSGAGKSTLLNMSCLLLYGKLDKLSKTAIANRINKNGYVKGYMRSGNSEYIIERTFSPNSINVFKDGIDINSIGVKDAQKYIEENIIQLPFQIFNNIVSLSMTKFKSFLNMTPEDRRQIIDRVFGLDTVNDIFNLIKKDIRDIGNNINTENAQIYALQNTINNAQNEILKISKENNQNNNVKIEEANKIINDETLLIQKCNEKYNEISSIYSNKSNEYQQILSQLQQLNVQKEILSQKIELFKNDFCPTCGTSLQSDSFKNIKDTLQNEMLSIDSSISEKTDECKKKNAYIQQLSNALITINKAITQSNNKISIAKNTLITINKLLKEDKQFQSIQNIIKTNTESLNAIKKEISINEDNLNDLNTLSMIYSIEGVKKAVIKNYLPQLNKEVEYSLEKLDFPYQLVFNENFDAQLSSYGNIISTETLSDGEHKRVDLAVLCSIFKLLKRKFPSINIFNLDEILSALDSDNINKMLRFLKTFALEQKLNIYVVTHVDIEADLFDEEIHVFKDLGFSDIEKTAIQ